VHAIHLEQKQFREMCNYSSLGDVCTISDLIEKSNSILSTTNKGGNVISSTEQKIQLLKMNMTDLKSSFTSLEDCGASDVDSVASDMSDLGNLTFTYEEEADPEVFFVPYIWDVIVCTLTTTTTTMEWDRAKIRLFPLNEEVDAILPGTNLDVASNDERHNTPDVV
jgi:hypothetical protein